MQKRHELTDEQWERIKPLLPPQKPSTGRSAIDHRRIIKGLNGSKEPSDCDPLREACGQLSCYVVHRNHTPMVVSMIGSEQITLQTQPRVREEVKAFVTLKPEYEGKVTAEEIKNGQKKKWQHMSIPVL